MLDGRKQARKKKESIKNGGQERSKKKNMFFFMKPKEHARFVVFIATCIDCSS